MYGNKNNKNGMKFIDDLILLTFQLFRIKINLLQ